MTTTSFSSDDIKTALPEITKSVSLNGLNGDIQILRDRYGIPHVRAESTHDAFFGQGFATAQDRLWHMDYDRRRAYGRWSEFVGPSGIEHDKQMRRFQLGASAKNDWDALDDNTKAMFESYADGVNAYIDSIEVLPIEYQVTDTTPDRWLVTDSLAVFKVRHILMGVFEGKLWRAQLVNELGPDRASKLLSGYQPGHLVITPTGAKYDGPGLDGRKELQAGLAEIEWLKDDDAGSNNWALDGSKTASGKPLIAGDPHRGLDVPNVYYQNHVAGPDFDVIGLSFPGCPGFPHFGHNQNVAWCVTHAGADYQDLYVENLRRTNDVVEYEFKGEWLSAEVRRESIKVCGSEPVEIEVAVTHHGPVISQSTDGTKGIAFRYTATAEPNRGYECMLKMLLATNADQIEESMRQWVDPCNNFVFGDVEGNIGYLNRGKVPLRSIDNAWLPVSGATGEHEWEGEIPFEDLPRINNPETGLIVTANNRIVGEDYPYYIALDFASEYRARRIYDRLNKLTQATASDMEDVHADIVSIPGQVYSALIARTHHEDKMFQIAKTHLRDWDGSMDRNLVAPTIYSAFRHQLHKKVFRHVFGELADKALISGGRGAPGHLRQLSSRLVTHAQTGDESLLPHGTNWDSLITSAFADGVNELVETLGDEVDAWTWGTVHQTAPAHPLSSTFPDMSQYFDPPPVPMSGDGDTPQAGSFPDSKPYRMTGMSVARYVWDTSDWDNSRWAVPLGASGHPGSVHYSDQISVWANVKLIPATYSWDKLEAESDNVQTIKALRTVGSSGGYDGSHQQYGVVIEENVMVKMRDGTSLATDLYYPAINGVRYSGQLPVILERTPYDKSVPAQRTKARFFARRGYVCAIQDVRGRLGSEGEWHPFAKEAPDGYDTVEWLGTQSWSNGKVGTMGDSYAGSDQAALATLNPPHLATMIVAVGASSYFHSSMRQNGALEQRFLIYAYRMAVTSHEASADPTLKAAIARVFEEGMPEIVNQFPIRKGSTILSRFTTYEQWAMELQQNGDYDDYWKQRGYSPVEYYDEHSDVPTLYLGGWYDSYARNTCECFMKLSAIKSSPQYLLMGPWTHGAYEVTYSGDLDFGLESHINYNDTKLAWFDQHLKGMQSEVMDWSRVRIFTMGGGEGSLNGANRLNHGGRWRNEPDWPVPSARMTSYYLRDGGRLTLDEAGEGDGQTTSYVFDPSYPVPTIGGGISAANPIMEPGSYDQRGDPSRFFGSEDTQPLSVRDDILTFQTEPLEMATEVTGSIEIHLWASSTALDTDFTAKLLDVYPPSPDFPEGLDINISDSIIRARYRNGFDKAELMEPNEIYEFVFELYPTSNVFTAGHRIRVDISSSNWPRFDVNHNTGGPLGTDRTYEVARQTIHHSEAHPSHVLLPIQRD